MEIIENNNIHRIFVVVFAIGILSICLLYLIVELRILIFFLFEIDFCIGNIRDVSDSRKIPDNIKSSIETQ